LTLQTGKLRLNLPATFAPRSSGHVSVREGPPGDEAARFPNEITIDF